MGETHSGLGAGLAVVAAALGLAGGAPRRRERDPLRSGGTFFIFVPIPYRGRHVWKKVKVVKGYRHDCGYGFWVGNSKRPTFHKDLRLFGIKRAPNVRNEVSGSY